VGGFQWSGDIELDTDSPMWMMMEKPVQEVVI
jgi:hypothetical protein